MAADGTLILTAGVPGVDPLAFRGNGSPEGVVVAPVSARYQRTDGGVGQSLYIKESGAGSTGWVAYGGGSSTATQVEVDFGTEPITQKTFTFTDIAALSTHRVIAGQAYAAPTGKDVGENEWDALAVIGGVLTDGTVTLTVHSLLGPVVGAFKVNYYLSTLGGAGTDKVSKAGDTMTGDLTISRGANGAYLTLTNNLGTTGLALDSAGNTVFSAAAQGFFDWSSYCIWRDRGNSTRNHLLLIGGASNDLALSSFGSRLSVGSTVTAVDSVLGVVGTAVTRVTQILRMFASQTADALRIEDSASTLLAGFKASGAQKFATANTSTTASVGAIVPPTMVTGYIIADVNGTTVKIPYYS